MYDHRIRDQVVATGNLDLFPHLDIPRGTTRTWIRRGPRPVVGVDAEASAERAALHAKLAKLERRVAVLTTVLRLVLTLVRVRGARLSMERLRDEADRRAILNAITHARDVMPLASALRVLRLSSARYHAWASATVACELDERPACARVRVNRLTPSELMRIRDFVLAPAYRHMSVRALALYAQRMGGVFAHPSTWGALIRKHGWRRPRARVHPEKPRLGVRAAKPNETWHIDVTILRLLDGTKVYLHAVIDNFSRKVLAWKASERLEPAGTCDVLVAAARHLHRDETPDLVCDSGVENVNEGVDGVLDLHALRRVLAQVDVTYSNSIIEAWWRSLKHQWLFLNQLDNIAAVRRLVTFYVNEHNGVMPHAAFDGATPDEVFYGSAAKVPEELAARREEARVARRAANQAVACSACPRAFADREGVAA